MDGEMEKKQGDYFLPISVLIAGVIIAGAVVYSAGLSGNDNETAALSPGEGVLPVGTAPEIGDDVILGDPDAPVTLVEFGDYQCPFCGRFFSQTEPLLRKDYIETGKIKMVYKDLAFLGPESVAAAEAAECARDHGKYWIYHDALFEEEIRDGREHNGNLNKALFMDIASSLELDLSAFETCVDSRKYKVEVEGDIQEARAIGANSTPTVYVNDVMILGAQPDSVFKDAIDKALEAR